MHLSKVHHLAAFIRSFLCTDHCFGWSGFPWRSSCAHFEWSNVGSSKFSNYKQMLRQRGKGCLPLSHSTRAQRMTLAATRPSVHLRTGCLHLSSRSCFGQLSVVRSVRLPALLHSRQFRIPALAVRAARAACQLSPHQVGLNIAVRSCFALQLAAPIWRLP